MIAPVKRRRGRAPTTEREQIGVADAMQRLALSRKQIEREIDAGMPHERDGIKYQFYWPDIRIWRDEHIRDMAAREKPAGGASPASTSRNRVLAAQAELAEIEVATARGALIPTAAAEAWFQTACTRVRARLLSLPPKLAAAAVGHKTPREAQSALQPILYEVMEELHRGDDVPRFDADTAGAAAAAG
jgi:PIN domain nuclease of toxin-antitoxin system